MKLSRRNFIKAGLGGGSITGLGLAPAVANAFGTCESRPYRAVVAINLAGGNDGFNCFVPTEPTQYAKYQALRKNMALPLNELVPLYFENDPQQLGLHPSLGSLSWLFDDGYALPIVNVGPLRYPVSKSDAESDNQLLPLHLYSHSHQTAVVQTQTTESIGDQGWGSLGANILGGLQGEQQLSPVYDMASQSIWGNSRQLSATRISSKLPNDHNFTSASRELYDTLRSPECTEGNLLQEYYSDLSYEAEDKYNTFASVMADDNDYGFADNWIASQLRNTYVIIKAQATLGQTTQYFSLMQGEYDTHND